MTAPLEATAAWRRRPRRSDHHLMVLDHVRYHETLVELSWLWTGRPMSDRPKYGAMEYRAVDREDCALHDYASNLAHCFLFIRADPRWTYPAMSDQEM